jgi:hypothetical protein
MTVTIGSMVDEVLADLYQYATTRPQFCTFQKWVTNGSDITGVELGDAAQQIINSYVELASGELIYVSNHGSGGNGSATVPSWFRAQLGSKPVDGVPENSKATIDPVWTRFGVSQKVVAGIESLYPDLFGVDEVVFPSTVQQSNYELPDDCDGVIAVTVGLIEELEMDVPPLHEVNTGRLIAMIDHSWDVRARIRKRIQRRLPDLQARARQTHQMLEEVLQGLPVSHEKTS